MRRIGLALWLAWGALRGQTVEVRMSSGEGDLMVIGRLKPQR
jgi:hypothetical protein